jgi:uncharacterized protein YyaL (SSP411 family)
MSNHLARETSPYLLQHSTNPVDWYPWGPEALARARAEDKPIFLSIGYAACHWCHVMAHESFEDAEIAARLNEWFVSIKVDREERPDLDGIYMQAAVSLTGRGGWPLSVFLTPEGVPFYGGTYFPPVPRYGMPAFGQVLQSVHAAWLDQREAILEGGHELLARLVPPAFGGTAALSRTTLAAAAESLWKQYDRRHAGWGPAPKFPQPMAIELLLRYHRLTGEALPREMALSTLHALAAGGIHDHLGGGFHRYATDAAWRVPHFEKMLYDNAQLARVYLHAWQSSGEAQLRRLAEETVDYVLRELTDPAGGFYASQDADSEGVEGQSYVWTGAEIDAALGPPAAAVFKAAYGITAAGNFEGRNILFAAQTPAALALAFNLPEAEVNARLASARQALLALRSRRAAPGLDDKVVTAWNGLMLGALAEAAARLERPDYLAAARANADFLLAALRSPEGRLFRTWRQGQARLNGYLDDYSHLADGLLALYEATFEPRYFAAARDLMDFALAHFADPAGGFFDTGDDHEPLVVRPKDSQDNALPSGNAMAAQVLLRLAAFTGEGRYGDVAEKALRQMQPVLAQHPAGFAQWLCALAYHLAQPVEVALVGDPNSADMRALLHAATEGFRPFQVLALRSPEAPSPIPLLSGREPVQGRPTAYVCLHFACQMPATDPQTLRQQLG